MARKKKNDVPAVVDLKYQEQRDRLIVFSKEDIEIVARLSKSCTIKQIAKYFGISEGVFYDIKKRQPEVDQVYQKGRILALEYVAGKLFKQIEADNLTAIMFYLKTKGGYKEAKVGDPDEEEDNTPIQRKIIFEFVEPVSNELKEVTPI